MASDDSTSNGKPKRDSKTLSLKPADARSHQRMERMLREVVMKFNSHCRSLRELRPQIEQIDAYFDSHPRGSVTLAGCRSFKECCEKLLHMSEQRVYAMLGDYYQKAKEKRLRKPKPASVLASPAKQEAAVRALDAISRYRTAKTQEAKDQAWKEYEEIADGWVAGELPDYQRLLRDVLDAAKAIETAALQLHAALCNIVESGLLDEGSSLLASTRASLTDAEKLLAAGKALAAVRRRLGIEKVVSIEGRLQ